MTDAQAELVARYRQMIKDLDSQIADLESGAVRFLRGNSDATHEAIALAKRQRAALQDAIAAV